MRRDLQPLDRVHEGVAGLRALLRRAMGRAIRTRRVGDLDSAFEALADKSCASGTDELLIDEEERRALEQDLERAHKPGVRGADPRTTFEILSVEHWSERDAVKWCGGSRKVARLAKRRAERIKAVVLPQSNGERHATIR